MALYLGNSERLNIAVNGGFYKPCVVISKPVTDLIRLLSSDNFILKDSNGIYLTVKENK